MTDTRSSGSPRATRRWLLRAGAGVGAAAALRLGNAAQSPSASGQDGERWFALGGSRLRVFFGEGEFLTPRDQLFEWVMHAASVVANYYGRFPVEEAYLGLLPVDGATVRTGKAYPFEIPTINVSVGREATPESLAADWVLIHEMVHLAFPSVPRRHHWIEEGIATYVEPVARAIHGARSAEEVWLEFVNGMPKGLPGTGDEGMDRTPTWGRTYWGGALFCLLADIEFERHSEGAVGLREALTGILDAGLSMRVSGEPAALFDIADRAAGVSVLGPLYGRWRETAVDVDLPALWQSLGVQPQGDGLRFDDEAPMAAVRQRMTARDATVTPFA